MNIKNKRIKVLFSLLLSALIVIFIITSSFHINVKTYNHAENKDNISRIVFISDLHGRSFGKNNSVLINKIRTICPDIICLGGDFINDEDSDDDISELIELLKQLRKIAPTYFSYGNHDLNYINANGDSVSDQIRNSGCIILEEEYTDIEIGDKQVRLGGMFDYAFNQQYVPQNEWNSDSTFKVLTDFTDTERIKILMCHRPDSFIYEDASNWDIDYVLSGHTHGGLWQLPLIGGVIAPEQGFFPTYDKGEFDIGNIKLIISSGFDGYKNIPRLFNCPEITVVEF